VSKVMGGDGPFPLTTPPPNPPAPPHPVPLHSVLSGVDENSKAARVDEKNNNDRTPHANSKLHNAVESCYHYLSHPHEPLYSSPRYRMFGTATLRRHCRGAS
jgi:hypothetical protein